MQDVLCAVSTSSSNELYCHNYRWQLPTVGFERRQKASHHAFGHTGVSDLGMNVNFDERGEVGEE